MDVVNSRSEAIVETRRRGYEFRASLRSRSVVPLVIALALSWGASSHADEVIVGERRFDPIGPESGISHRSVSAIVQDSLGFLWFGTDEGLNRFDGVSSQVWLRATGSSDGLASSRIAALMVDRDGHVWSGTRGGGISRFDPITETFTTFRHSDDQPDSLAQDDVVALAEDNLGRIWIGTSKAGLDRLDDSSATAELAHFVHYRRTDDGHSIPDDRVRTLLHDRSGRLWIGTMNGVGRLEADGGFTRFQGSIATDGTLTDDEVWSLEVDDRDRLWVGTWGGGLFRSRESAESSELTFDHYPGNGQAPGTLTGSRVMSLHQDHSGTLWIGTFNGLHELPPECFDDELPSFVRHFHALGRPDSLPSNRVSAIAEDAAGDLWFATTKGPCRLERTHEELVVLRVARDGTTPPSVQGVVVAADGAIWIATDAGILRVRLAKDRRGLPSVLAVAEGERGLPGANVVTLMCDREGAIWIATYDGLAFISAHDATLDEFQVTHLPAQPNDPNGLSSNAVLALHQDENDQVWIGTYRGLHRAIRDEAGLPIRFEGYFSDPDDPNSLSSRSVSSIATFDGDLWVGTNAGLNRMDRGSGRCQRFAASPASGELPHGHITSLLRDDAGTLWIGTLGGGVARRDPGDDHFDILGLERGMPSELVYAFGKTGEGSVWAATAGGIVRVHPFRDDVLILSERDGLPADEINLLSSTPDGRLVAAAGSRLIIATAHDLEPGTVAPRVILTSVRVDNDRRSRWSNVSKAVFEGTSDVIVANSESALRIDFAAPNYRHPDHIRYRYRMTGLSSSWVTTSGERRAFFPLLSPGNYTFELSTALGDGAWSDPGVRISIQVLPPWWRTWWAMSLAVILLIIAAVTIPVVRLSQVRHQAVLLDATVAERTAELAEVNRQLAVAARTDPLTQLPNRRAAAERVEIERATVRRYQRPLSVALLDIDYFKNVNDDFGHDVGDRVLRVIGQLLRATLREHDFVARWGGEEFLMLLPETPLSSGAVVADALRQRIASLTIPEVDGRNLTVTIGITSLFADEAFEACVNRADHALYEGKHAGRNRVVSAPGSNDPIAPPTAE